MCPRYLVGSQILVFPFRETHMKHLQHSFVVLLVLLLILPVQSFSQAQAGRAGFGFSAGGAKYFGEFSDNSWWLGGDLFFRYNIIDRISLQAQFGLANPRYRVDVDNGVAKYSDYFGTQPDGSSKIPGDRFPNGTLISDDSEERRNNTRIFTYEVTAALNLLPGEKFNPYIFGGVGMMSYQVRPGLSGGSGLGKNTTTGEVGVGILPGQESGLYTTTGLNGGLIFPVGLGFELYLTDDIAFNGKATYRITSTKYLDDYNPGSMLAYDAATQKYTTVLPAPNGVENGSNDAFLTIGLGFTYYVFGNADFDKDGITNSQEKIIGTDENNPDTDGDGLPDGYEYLGTKRVPPGFTEEQLDALPDTDIRSNPLKQDSDEDGLSDRQEFVLHKTNPINADTDADGLKDNEELSRKTDPLRADSDSDDLLDGDEVSSHKTDPLKADTDEDGLNDGDEIKKYATNPAMADTDSDGLNDGAEVNSHKTSPSKADTDSDGLSDGDEINQAKTDPLKPDTDGDSLSDGEEVKTHKSNPLVVDTDEDSLTDGDEVNKYKTNPVLKDTDLDGLADGEEVNTYSTDPSKKDTDEDALTDGDEVNTYKTNPKMVDTDADGLKDGEEVTEFRTNPAIADTDKDGLGDGDEVKRTKTNPLDPDTDRDTFLDGKDRCPLIAGVAPDGCPEKPKPNTVTNFPGVLFIVNTDKFKMDEPSTMESLNKIKALVDQCEDLTVEIEGHASSEGNAKRNQELSEMRAQAIKSWLINQGIDGKRIVRTVGYGSSRPTIPEPTKGSKDALEAARKQNRRIAVRVIETCK